jgi:hypothetical protein
LLALLLVSSSASFGLAVVVGFLFTKLTLAVSASLIATVAVLTVLVGTTAKAAVTLVRLPREHELKDLCHSANRHALIAAIGSLASFIGSTFSRSDGSLPLWLPLASFGGLEIGCAALGGSLLTLFVIHRQPGRLYAIAEREADLAAEWDVAVEELSGASGEGGSGAKSRDGARQGLAALPLAFMLGALLWGSAAHADVEVNEVRLFVDKTPSASPDEVDGSLRSFDQGCEGLLASMPAACALKVYLWRGDIASSRTARETYDLPCRAVEVASELDALLPARGQYQRAKEARALAERRRPVIAAARADILRLASLRLACTGASCVRQLLWAAESPGAVSIVISDVCQEGCKAGLSFPKGDRSRILIVLVTRLSDKNLGAERLQARLLKLRAQGYQVIDAKDLASLDWSTIFEKPTARAAKAGR